MNVIRFENYTPKLGPPCPMACPDGWESHTWNMTIEEGQVGMSTDCPICDRGVAGGADAIGIDHHEWEMEAIPVRITGHVENEHSDSVYVWWAIQAVR